MKHRAIAIWAGPAAAVAVGLTLSQLGLPTPAANTAAVATLCAIWWIFEPIPIPVTSLVPFAAFPVLGVLDHKTVATAYGHHLILLLLGGFILSTAIERCGAHRRLALGMVRLVGGKDRKRVVLGFMIASAVCSMWISNTATVLMMLPIAMAILDTEDDGQLAVPLLLGIAYASSIGGIGTPIGTPPNAIFLATYEEVTQKSWLFLDWMKEGLPVVVVFLPIAWLFLTRGMAAGDPIRLPAVGPWKTAERRVLTVFAITALAWIFLDSPFGGWSRLIAPLGPDGQPHPAVGLSTVPLIAVIVLFLLPDGEGGKLLDWETATKIPWGLLLLSGGGIALAKAFGASGLSAALGNALTALTSWPRVGMVVTLCLCVTFLTEITSNTATTTLLMPILASAAIGAGQDPATLMLPAAMSASCAFMLPVATAPNAIVFGSGRVPSRTMFRQGLGLNLIGVVVISAVTLFL